MSLIFKNIEWIGCVSYVFVFDYNENVGRLNRSSVLMTDYDTVTDRVRFDLTLSWHPSEYFYPKWYAIGFNQNKNPNLVSC